MDSAPLLQTFGPWATAIILLLTGMKWMASRLARAEERADARANAAEKRCDDDRKSLSDKVDRLEDQIAGILDDTVRKSTEALQANIEWFRRFVEMSDSDLHRARQHPEYPRKIT